MLKVNGATEHCKEMDPAGQWRYLEAKEKQEQAERDRLEAEQAEQDRVRVKEKVERLKGLMDYHDGDEGKGYGLSKIIAIFRKDYIDPIFRGQQSNKLDSEAVSLATNIIEGITSDARTVASNGITSIGNLMVLYKKEDTIPKDICSGLGYLLEDLGALQAEIKEIDYDIALSLAWRLEKELKEKEQLVEATALKAL